MIFNKGLIPLCLILISYPGSWGKPRVNDDTTQGDDDDVVTNEDLKDQGQTANEPQPPQPSQPPESPQPPQSSEPPDSPQPPPIPGDRTSLDEKVKKISQTCICPILIMPVCGTDGVTYPNRLCIKCVANDPNVRLAHMGACNANDKLKQKYVISKSPYADTNLPFPCYCPLMENLVCDADGDTHYNVHCMKCIKPRMTISKNGPCDVEDSRYPGKKD